MARAIDLLVAAGADVNAQDGAGDTLLHNAALEYSHQSTEENYFGSSDGCNYTAVQRLLHHGAFPDPVGKGGRTPLMLAADSGSVDALQILIAAGVNPQRKDHCGQTAMDRARQAYAKLQSQTDEFTTPEDQAGYQTYLKQRQQCVEVLTNAGLPPQ